VRAPVDLVKIYSAERIEYWARWTFREWALRPGPVWTYLTNMLSPVTFRSVLEIELESLEWTQR
jgi:hypothetical protein